MVTFLFAVTDELRAMFIPGQVVLVHDDGVYLCERSGVVPGRIRPINGNQGFGPGRGDDWVETLDSLPALQPDDKWLIIRVTDEELEIITVPERIIASDSALQRAIRAAILPSDR